MASSTFSFGHWYLLLGLVGCAQGFSRSLACLRFGVFLYCLLYFNTQHPVVDLVKRSIARISAKRDEFLSVLPMADEQLCSWSFCAQ
jgi:hypothetical protein